MENLRTTPMCPGIFHLCLPLLAQRDPELNIGKHLIWSAACILILLLAFAAVSIYRRWMNAPEDSGGGFVLSDLRKLHREGKMTTEEFEKAKAIIIENLKRSNTPSAPEQGPRTNGAGENPSKPANS